MQKGCFSYLLDRLKFSTIFIILLGNFLPMSLFTTTYEEWYFIQRAKYYIFICKCLYLRKKIFKRIFLKHDDRWQSKWEVFEFVNRFLNINGVSSTILCKIVKAKCRSPFLLLSYSEYYYNYFVITLLRCLFPKFWFLNI